MIAKTQNFDTPHIKTKIETLCASNKIDRTTTTVQLVKEIVPEYISKNSQYEQLDPNH